MRELKDEFADIERVALQDELRGNVEPERQPFLGRHIYLLHLQISNVEVLPVGIDLIVQDKFQVAALHVERGFLIVELRDSIAQFKIGDAQIEQRVAPRPVRLPDARRRQVAFPVAVDFHRHLRVIDGKSLDRKFPAQQREDSDRDVCTVRME